MDNDVNLGPSLHLPGYRIELGLAWQWKVMEGKIMEGHEMSWKAMECYGRLWKVMESHGKPWNVMVVQW